MNSRSMASAPAQSPLRKLSEAAIGEQGLGIPSAGTQHSGARHALPPAPVPNHHGHHKDNHDDDHGGGDRHDVEPRVREDVTCIHQPTRTFHPPTCGKTLPARHVGE